MISIAFVFKSIGNIRLYTYVFPVPVNVSVWLRFVTTNDPDVLSNFIVECIPLTNPLPNTAINFAGLPPDAIDPFISTTGGFKYPVPGLVTSTDSIFPPCPRVTLAVAPDPVSDELISCPTNLITGGCVYPLPASAIFISFI